MRDRRAHYVVVSLVVNLLFLVRSYVFMLVLDYRELGLITLLQSIVLLLGILQFGVLSGGYRLLLSSDEAERQGIVDLVYSFIAVLGAATLIIAGIAMMSLVRPEDGVVGLLGVLGGTASLIRSWQTNQMIASGRLGLLNAINLGSSLISLACFALLPLSPIYACVAVIVSQPVLFAMCAWATGGAPAMKRLTFSGSLARRIFAAGFVLFLASMLLQLNIQLERWYVTAELGIDALGHLFIANMMVTLLQLVPAALDAIFLPAAVRSHGDGDTGSLARTVRAYLLLLLAYVAIALAAIVFLAEPVLAVIAPKYVQDLIYGYLIAPGALMLVLVPPFALIFTVLLRFRLLLLSYGAGTIALTIILGAAVLRGMPLSLEGVMTARSFALGLTAVSTIGGWWLLSRNHPEFRRWIRR